MRDSIESWATSHFPHLKLSDLLARYQPADGNPDEARVVLILHWPPLQDTTVALSQQKQGTQVILRTGFDLDMPISVYNYLAIKLSTASQLG